MMFSFYALRAYLSYMVLGLATVGVAQFGVLDNTFGTNGSVVLLNNDGHANTILVLPDDRILVAGNEASALTLYQMLPDGEPDPAFGDNGSVSFIGLLPERFVPEELLLAANGEIILVGRTQVSGQDYELAVARFSATGILIDTFGDAGVVTFNEGPGSMWPMDAALISDGRIVVCAGSSNGACLMRLNDDGSFDPSFGTDGVLLYPASGTVCEMAIDVFDRIVITGRYTGTSIYLARFDGSGTLDPSFGNAGVVITDQVGGSAYEFVFALGIQPNGSLVVGGIMMSNHVLFAERYDANGALDPSFGTNGRVITDVNDIEGRDLLVQADGAVIIAACFDIASAHDILLFRLLADGTPDPTFGTAGRAIIIVSGGDDVQELGQQSGGRVLTCGHAAAPGVKWMMARITCHVDVGIYEEEVSGMTISPNPSDSPLFLQATALIERADVLDLQGRVVTSSSVRAMNGQLDLSAFPEGMYVVQVQFQRGGRATQKVVIKR